jgi:hypothetical protein
MITDPAAWRLDEAIHRFRWYQEAAADERLKLGRRYRKWLTFKYECQLDNRPTHQGVQVPGERVLNHMLGLGLITYDGPQKYPLATRDWRVTRDGQAAVTWHYDLWAPMDCAPTWGLPILCAIPGDDRWHDRFYVMRAERRINELVWELVWITPSSGATLTDRFTAGLWRAIP